METVDNTKFEVFSDFSNTLTISQVTASATGTALAVTPGSYILSQAETSFTTMEMANTTVPEPNTMLLFGTGIAGLAAVSRRNK